jgi:hypothetical protein
MPGDAGGDTKQGTEAPAPASVVAFLDRFRLLLRAVRVYPVGHSRVKAALSAFRSAISVLGADIDLAVRSDALLVSGQVVSLEGEAAKEIHAALSATGVGWIVAEGGVGDDAWIAFMTRLHSNQRRVTGGRGVPEDLWSDRIPGIEVELLRFERSAFAEGARSSDGAGGGAGGGGGGIAGAGGEGEGIGAQEAGSSDLLALLLRDRMVRVLLRRIRAKVLAVPEDVVPDAEDDLLARLLRFLPFEVRSDPLRGLRVVRESLAKFLVEAGERSEDAQSHRLVARLANAAADVFVAPAAPDASAPAVPVEPRAPDPVLSLEDLEAICREASVATGAPIAETEHEVEPASVLVHGVLDLPAEEEAERRETWRLRLVELLRDGGAAAVDCMRSHLADASGPDAEGTAARHKMLLTTALEAGLGGLVASSGKAALDLVVRTFPRHLAAYAAVDGAKVEDVMRALGFDRVLAAGPDLLAPGGALHGDAADALFEDRSVGTLPLVAVLLGAKDGPTRERGLRVLKAIKLPPTVEVLVRAVPLSYLPPVLRRQICRDVFDGADLSRLSKPAVSAISAFLQDPAHQKDTAARTYATAALASFDREDAEPVLRHLLRRHLVVVPVEPRAIRRQAKLAIKGIAEHERQRFKEGRR